MVWCIQGQCKNRAVTTLLLKYSNRNLKMWSFFLISGLLSSQETAFYRIPKQMSEFLWKLRVYCALYFSCVNSSLISFYFEGQLSSKLPTSAQQMITSKGCQFGSLKEDFAAIRQVLCRCLQQGLPVLPSMQTLSCNIDFLNELLNRNKSFLYLNVKQFLLKFTLAFKSHALPEHREMCNSNAAWLKKDFKILTWLQRMRERNPQQVLQFNGQQPFLITCVQPFQFINHPLPD